MHHSFTIIVKSLSHCWRKFQDFFQMNSGKRKREDLASQYPAGGFIPQQDGAGDAAPEVFEIEVCFSSCFIF